MSAPFFISSELRHFEPMLDIKTIKLDQRTQNSGLWDEKFLRPSFKQKEWDLIVDEPAPFVYKFPVFNEFACDEFIRIAKETGNFQRFRHSDYQTTDMELKDIGLENSYVSLMNDYLPSFLKWAFDVDASGFNYENFVAKYTMDDRRYLSPHYDDSYISTMCILNDAFTGGGTWFPKFKKLIKPKTGEMILFPGGITHQHAAREIESGVRYILVSFIK